MTLINRSDASVSGAGFGTVAILPPGFDLLQQANAVYVGTTVENAGPLAADDIILEGNYELGDAYRKTQAVSAKFTYPGLPNIGQNDYCTLLTVFRSDVAPGSTQTVLGDRAGGKGILIRISPTALTLVVEATPSAYTASITLDPTAAVWFVAVTRTLNAWNLYAMSLSDNDAVMQKASVTITDANYIPGDTAFSTGGDSTGRLLSYLVAGNATLPLSEASLKILAAGAKAELTVYGVLPWSAE